MNLIVFTIFLECVLIRTITQTINFTENYWAVPNTSNVTGFLNSQIYNATMCNPIFVNNNFTALILSMNYIIN